ncbi:MAG: putative ABC transporter permease [Erysipelotrichaceae bacterium]
MSYFKEYLNTDMKFDRSLWIGIFCLIIVLSGVFGFVYEFVFYYFDGGMKTFYFRGGNFLPWINIYAYGAILVYLFTYRYRKQPLKVFLISLIACGLLEYLSGYVLYNYFGGIRYWDYNIEIWNFGNIGGFVCLRSVLFFGLSSLFLMYAVIPFVYYLAQNMNSKVFITICVLLFVVIFVDDIYNLVFTKLLNTPSAIDIYSSMGIPYVN